MKRRFLRPAIAITIAVLTSFLLVKNSSAQDLGRRRQPITWRDVRAPFTPGIGAIIGLAFPHEQWKRVYGRWF